MSSDWIEQQEESRADCLALADFLRARIAEVEWRLDLPEFIEEDSARGPGWGNRGECPACGAYQFSGTEPVTEEAWWEHAESVHQRARVLARCKADRRIVGWFQAVSERVGDVPALEPRQNELGMVLRALASPYADHPDYREEWKP